ncbi:triokinase/FMN cyclase-like isoform X1 [Diorhabda carinulata]|uniref:triokinase/FMN cyclase-like isoform X1 n=2 Tax=Diorhabda carinulata TaxID=1163345 RepID=UPI0025A2E191|nr:triokinase/FMN cyclase-like isoform X1 [Diorhabda carinulata]
MDFKVLSSHGASLKIRNSLVGATSLNQEVGLFNFGNVIVQKDYTDNDCVRIISGGPYYIGDFVGKGMLTAAIQGDNFTAPASSIILRTLRELSNNHIMGSLVIVPASSGCTLNFGLAIERALNDDIVVKMLTVSDDFFNNQQSKMSQRTLSAVVLIYKIAGAMAAAKKSLCEIYDYCNKICQYVQSMEIELPHPNITPNATCICIDDPFGSDQPTTVRSDHSHETIKVPLANLISIIVNESNYRIDYRKGIDDTKLELQRGDKLVILLNNNAVISKTEENICVKDILDYLIALNINVVRFYVGNFIKCHENALLTITLMKIEDKNVLTYLDAHYGSIPGWPNVNQNSRSSLTTETNITGNLRRKNRLEPPIRGPQLSERATNTLYFAIQFACDALIACEKQLNVIDSERDDGDTGTRMKTVAELLVKRMKQDKLLLKYPFTFFETMSNFLEKSLGGTSGCVYSILFEAAANKFGEYNSLDVTPEMWLESFEAAGAALKKYGNIKYGDGTLYDPICKFCETAKQELENCSHPLVAFGNAVQCCEETVNMTKRDKNYPDPGAHAVGIWIRAVFEGVKLKWPLDAVCL